MKNTALILNPRYLSSGFGSQAANIRKYEPLPVRKLACYMSVVTSFIRKHGAFCYASTDTIMNSYNELAPKFDVKPIKRRTVHNLQEQAARLNLVQVSTYFDEEVEQNRRRISFILDGIEQSFSAVFNWALKAADKFCRIQNLRLGGSPCGKAQEPSNGEVLARKQGQQNCSIRSKILSKDKINKNNGSGRLSYDAFLIKYFEKDADEVKSLQNAARNKNLTATGAKKLIELHNKHRHQLAPTFRKFLNHLIAKAHSEVKNVKPAKVVAVARTKTIQPVSKAPCTIAPKPMAKGRSVFARIRSTFGAGL